MAGAGRTSMDEVAAQSVADTIADTLALPACISTARVQFARTGNPNHASRENALPQWPPYSLPARPTMVFDNDSRVVSDLHAEDRLAIAAVGPHANYIESVKRKFTKQAA